MAELIYGRYESGRCIIRHREACWKQIPLVDAEINPGVRARRNLSTKSLAQRNDFQRAVRSHDSPAQGPHLHSIINESGKSMKSVKMFEIIIFLPDFTNRHSPTITGHGSSMAPKSVLYHLSLSAIGQAVSTGYKAFISRPRSSTRSCADS